MPKFKINEITRHEIERFKGYMRKQEYTKVSITGYCTYLSRFLRKIGLPQSDVLQNAIEAFLETERVNNPRTFKDCRAALRLYFKMDTGSSLKNTTETYCAPEIANLLKRFCEYSLEVKHIEEATASSEVSHVRGFLEYAFRHDPQGFTNGLTAEDVRRYVVERLSMLSNSSKGRIITSIRNFFRCEVFYGQQVHPSIFRLPLSPAVWKQSAFPTTIDNNIFNTLHRIPDKNTDTGKRNLCIILFFTELALRCSEVAALTLDDINWRGGYVTIRNTKNASDRVLPLSASIGNALVEYLEHARPQTICRALFVRFSHKRGAPMGLSQIRNMVRRNSKKAGLEDSNCGTHILRRTAATKLYNSGNSLKLTADILGHESLDSTVRYTRTDVTSLLSVSSPWPGGERSVR